MFRSIASLKSFDLNPFKTNVDVLFRESITRILPTQGDALEVAVLETNDTLTRRDTKTLFDLLYLGTTISEIKVKVTYRYHIRISDDWEIASSGSELRIVPPQIRPTLPPSIHTDQMEKRSESGWLRFNAKENLDNLESSVTQILGTMALTPAKLVLVNEASKKAIENFVQQWILSREEWKDYRSQKINVQLDPIAQIL